MWRRERDNRTALLECQSFHEGCCGCCVNMQWPAAKASAWLEANTRMAGRLVPGGARPTSWLLVRWHLRRGGWIDHLLACWLVPFTLGLSAWLWQRFFGSCCFAGFIDPPTRRVGCLIHPARWPGRDLRRHAFPLVPTLNCDRALICPMLRSPHHPPLASDWQSVSRAGAISLRRRRRGKPTCAAR